MELNKVDNRHKPGCFGVYILSKHTSKCSSCNYRILCKRDFEKLTPEQYNHLANNRKSIEFCDDCSEVTLHINDLCIDCNILDMEL